MELAIRTASIAVDGDLAEWPESAARILLAEKLQVRAGSESWADQQDASGDFRIAFDTNHLFLAGVIRDDQIKADADLVAAERTDRIEIVFRLGGEVDAASAHQEDLRFLLMPLSERRPWGWSEASRAGPRSIGNALAGVKVAARRVDATTYQFEAAIPFHQLAGLRAGAPSIGFGLSLHDHDDTDSGRSAVLSWQDGGDTPCGVGSLVLPSPGPLVAPGGRGALWTQELFEDLPYLLVPLVTVVALILLLRGWGAIRGKAQRLRPWLVAAGVVLFALGLWLPSLLTDLRASGQEERLHGSLQTLQSALGYFEQGTLRSFRGPSRDRALMDLLAGKRIVRQRTTNYRTLAALAPDKFGPGVKSFDDLPVRAYWLPLPIGGAESFQFDPPLRGTQIHLVVGRPFVPSFSFPVREAEVPRLRLELDFGAGDKRAQVVEIDHTFTDAAGLGQDYFEACAVPVPIDRDLRALSVAALRGTDLRLVGLSLETAAPGQLEAVPLGTPTMGGVLTDLRGPYPLDAGLELAPGSTAKVAIAPATEAPQKLWFFYRAIYPGVPTTNPGARVAEIVLHFRNGEPRRSLVLEHQVSMFYEMARNNTCDEPPEGSPAAIALSWVDESLERHVNLGYPVPDLPAGAELESIEFRNLAEYKMRFRSVVFGNERMAAPQDPPDSPLQREGPERWLPADLLQQFRDVPVLVYRGNRLSEATVPVEQQKELLALPRAVSGAGVSSIERTGADGSRRVALYAPLSGDGWDGAVLAVASADVEWAAARQWHSRLGFVLCLLGTPFLLVLLSELLAVATNLRFRLMAVLSVASLAPLGVLSLVLVRVLEGGHASTVQEGMRATVQSAIGQLDDQKEKLRGSAQRWLHDLAQLAAQRFEKVAEAQFAGTVPAVAGELQKLMAGQLPPEWRGGFLRLEWQPALGDATAEPPVVIVGDGRMANVETPARLDPGVSLQWGVMWIGVRTEQTVRGGTFGLTAGRPIDGNLLGALAPGQVVLLTDARGYPIAASAARADAEQVLAQAMDPAVMAERERALGRGTEERKPVVARVAAGRGAVVQGSEVLRDLQDTPRGLLVVEQADQRATLDLPIGRIPVRAFFLLAAGSLVVLAAFLSFVVSSRITRPIERLEHGARALSRGVLDTRVALEEGGQIGSLTRTFNQMAEELQGRMQDLQALNRTMRDLSAQASEPTTLDVLRTFCAGHTAADSVRVVLVGTEVDRVVLHTGAEPAALTVPGVGRILDRIVGAFSAAALRGSLGSPWKEVLPDARSLVGLPIAFAGRTRGVVLLGFARLQPLPADLELLGTVVAQAAIALERAQLHRLAVQDPVTGAYTPEYFRRRAVDEVSLAQQRGVPLSMVAVALGDGDRRPRGLRRFVAKLREALPSSAVLCHEGAGRVQAVLPGLGRAVAESLLERAFAAWGELVHQLPENEVEDKPPVGVVVQFPDEAPSSELLFDALRERLAAVHTPGASAMESDESLQRAGVTAISPAMREVYTTLRRVAPTDLPILLEGETGVGKEVLTNLVHSWSRRAGGPLVKVHCAALTETLLASELFGHEKGAFTGAERRKIGRFEQADGGTLFLDEVGDIPPDVQVKLLRVLQEREVDRVGGTEPIKVDVRVIAATNRDISKLVADGRFREDLYYRLQGMVVRVPALRERKAELPGLVEHFRQEVVEAGQSHATAISPDAMDELFRHDWPGNIRELRNTVFRAMVMARGGAVQQRDVAAALAGSVTPAGSSAADRPDVVATAPKVAAVEPAVPIVVSAPTSPPTAVEQTPPAPVPEGDRNVAPAAACAPPAELAVGEQVAPGPRPESTFPLPDRLRQLHEMILAKGKIKTEDHMAAAGVSHRTGLRDLQYLVRIGLVARVGSRRGTFYRPAAKG